MDEGLIYDPNASYRLLFPGHPLIPTFHAGETDFFSMDVSSHQSKTADQIGSHNGLSNAKAFFYRP